MGSWTIYRADGAVREVVWSDEVRIPAGRYAVPELEYNGEWMGEAFVTLTVRCAVPVEFEVGDYVLYRGEKFVMNYDPTVVKKARRGTHGEGFVYENVKFNSLGSELSDARMLDYVIDDNLIHYSGLPKFSFFCKDVDDLADRLQVNMNRYCDLNGFATNDYWLFLTPSTDGQGNPVRTLVRAASCGMDAGVALARWTAVYGGTADGRRVAYQSEKVNQNVSVDNQSVWDCCKNVKDVFGLNFIVRGRDLCIGTAGLPTADIFRYGKGKGLYEIERTADSEQAIVTKLFAYGSSKNLPTRYYAELNMQVWASVSGVEQSSLETHYIQFHLDLPFDRRYFTVRSQTNPGDEQFPNFVIRVSANGYTVKGYVTLEGDTGECRIYCELKGSQDDDRDEEDVNALDAFISALGAGDRIDFVSGVDKSAFPSDHRGSSTENLPNNMALDVLMLPGFPNQSLYDWVISPTGGNGTALSGGDDNVGHAEWRGHRAYFSKDKYQPYILSENYLVLGIREAAKYFDGSDGDDEIFPTIENTGKDAVVSADRILDNGVFGEGDIPNFKIRLPDFGSGFDLKALLQSDTAIEMKDGYCGGRSFTVVGAKKVDGVWECECKRSSDDALDLYFPYQHGTTGDAYQVLAGDKYVLTGIEMTDTYVEEAAKVLLEASLVFLDANDYTRYTYVPRVDEIYMARQHDAAVASRGGNAPLRSYYETLKEGDVMLFEDADLGIDGSVFIDTLRIKEYGNGQIPTYEVTLRNDKQVGTIQRIQEKINSLTSTGGGGGGVNVPQIQSLIGTYGKELFLSKKEADAAQGFIQFLQGMGVGSSGMGISRDGAARLLSVVLNGGYGIDAGGKATLADVVARLITATGLVSPDYGGDDLVGGSGFKMEYDALTGRSSVFTDFLTVRMKAIFAALEIRKVTYSSGTLVVSGAGSEAYKVAPVGADGASPFVPAEYEALEYLEKTGNAGYFITPYLPNERTRIEAEVMFPDELGSGFATLWCSRTSTAYTIKAPSFALLRNETNGNLRLDWRNERNNSSVAVVRGVRTTVVAENGLLTFTDENGNTVTIGSAREDEWEAIYVLKIWATVNGNASSTTNLGRGRIYRFRIYEGDVLLHDYQPARRVADGHLGLYDLATDAFLENNGATDASVTAGDVIQTAETQANEHFKAHWREVEEADTYAHRIYCVADDGTTATMNDWHVGDQVLCQTFNIDDASLVHTNISNRYWWRLALRTGTEVLDDGKQYTWVEVASSRQNLQITEPMMQAYAVYADLYAAYQAMSEKPSFFEAYATVFPRYDGGGEGEVTACDVPEEGDTMAQVGSQTDTARQGLAMVRAEGLDSGFYIYTPVTRFTLRDTLVTKITPRGTVMSSQFFRIVSSADVGNPKPLTVFRGEWSASEAYAYYDEVTYGGERWACVNAAGVAAGGNPPSRTNSDWLLTVAKGNDGEAGVVRWMEVSLQSVRVRKNNGHYFLTESQGSSDVLTVTLYEQRGGVTEKVRDDNYLYIGGYVNQINPILGAFGIDEYVSIDQYLIWDATNERYTSDSAGFPVGLNFDELMFRWTDTGGNVYAEHKVMLNLDGAQGDKGDAGTNGHAFTLSPTQAVVTQTATRGTDGNYTYGWDVNNNSVLTSAQYRSGNGGAVACGVSVLSVVPSAAVGIFQPDDQMEVGNVGINTSALTAFVRQYGQNSVAATLRLVSGNIYQDLTFNLYINRLGTMKSETVGDATKTIREKTRWVVDPETGEWKQMAYQSDVTDAADRFSRELSALPVSKNLLLNTEFADVQSGGVRALHVVGSTTGARLRRTESRKLLGHEKYFIVSFYGRGSGTVTCQLLVRNGNTTVRTSSQSLTLTQNMQRKYAKFNTNITGANKDEDGYSFILTFSCSGSSQDIYISRPQLEEVDSSVTTPSAWTGTESRNLLPNSSFGEVYSEDGVKMVSDWEYVNTTGISLAMEVPPYWSDWNDDTSKLPDLRLVTGGVFKLNPTNGFQGIKYYSSAGSGGRYAKVLEHGGQYTVSFMARAASATGSRADFIIHFYKIDADGNIAAMSQTPQIGREFDITNEWTRFEFGFTLDESGIRNMSSSEVDLTGYGFCFMIGCSHWQTDPPTDEVIEYKEIQFEKGLGATAWQAASYDNALRSSRIEQTAEQIEMSVKKGEKVGGIRIDETGTTLFGEQTTVEGDLDLQGLTTENVTTIYRSFVDEYTVEYRTLYPYAINMGVCANSDYAIKSVQIGKLDLQSETFEHVANKNMCPMVVLPFYDSNFMYWKDDMGHIDFNTDPSSALYGSFPLWTKTFGNDVELKMRKSVANGYQDVTLFGTISEELRRSVRWKRNGTRLTISNEYDDKVRNWKYLDGRTWVGTDKNMAGHAISRAILVCSDGRIVCEANAALSNGYAGANTLGVTVRDYAGRFSCEGYVARFILVLPGQSLQLRSHIAKISDNQEVLIWIVENSSEYVPLTNFPLTFKSLTYTSKDSAVYAPMSGTNAVNEVILGHSAINACDFGGLIYDTGIYET